jgi:2'-5' RNA ligase
LAAAPEARPWRLFVAAELPDSLRDALGAPLDGLAGLHDWIRASEPGQIHLTLHFLGGVDAAKVPAIMAALQPAIGRHEPFVLTVQGVNAFGGRRRPRVLWAGFANAGLDRIKALRRDTAAALERVGFPIEPDFRPHLTLGRARRFLPREGLPLLERWFSDWREHEFGQLSVESVHLMRSQLGQGPAQHSSLARFDLQ